MTQTIDRTGRPLFFPPSMDMDDAGMIIPRPFEELAMFAANVAPHELFPFIRRLINGTSRRRNHAKWAAVNEQRLLLARLCIERAMTDGTLARPH